MEKITSLTSRFSFQAMRIDSLVINILLALWLTITLCTISSILSQPFSKKQRLFWILLVVAMPLFGILAYLPFSINKDDVSDIFMMRHKKGKKRSGAGSVTHQG